MALVSRHDYARAREAFSEAIALEPHNIEYLNAQLLTLSLIQDFEAADGIAEQILAIFPDHLNAFIVKGLYCKSRGEIQRARHYFTRVRNRDPRNTIALKNLELLRELERDTPAPVDAFGAARRYPRFPVRMGLYVNYFEATNFRLEQLLTLSRGGGFIASQAAIEVGEQIQFILPVGTTKRIQGVAKVVYRGFGGPKQLSRGFAIEFAPMKAQEASLITKVLTSLPSRAP